MKKILLLIIGVIVGGTIGVKASTLIQSNQIIYKENETVDIALDNLFGELKLGKNKIAEAITNKGIETTSNNTLEEMANKISSIEGGNSYLRLNEETGYVQGLDESGNWINLAYVHSFPIQNINYIQDSTFTTSSFSPISYTTQGTNL